MNPLLDIFITCLISCSIVILVLFQITVPSQRRRNRRRQRATAASMAPPLCLLSCLAI
jgi:hypothetical protein